MENRPPRPPTLFLDTFNGGCRLLPFWLGVREVYMPTRLVSILVVFLAVPALTQQQAAVERVQQGIWSRGQMMRPDSPPEADARAAQQQAIHEDAVELSKVSASLQSDLQQLQKGLLTKDLAQNLKKVEKLSKKLRQEVAQ
jgi:hypothetical protein